MGSPKAMLLSLVSEFFDNDARPKSPLSSALTVVYTDANTTEPQ